MLQSQQSFLLELQHIQLVNCEHSTACKLSCSECYTQGISTWWGYIAKDSASHRCWGQLYKWISIELPSCQQVLHMPGLVSCGVKEQVCESRRNRIRIRQSV